ncbi:MAG TPA: YciI family protein [Gaiellaceae bacterium]|nr:YciI family protein [Gaiellaceae bacterium]
MPHWIVTRVRGGSWNPVLGLREQELWDEHAAFMEALVADGFVVLGGPLYGDGTALLLVEADSEREVEERLAADPWTPVGVLRTGEIRRWEILLRAQ